MRNSSSRRLHLRLQQYLRAFALGVFPMGDPSTQQGIEWHTVDRRGVLPLDQFKIPRRLRRTARRNGAVATVNHDFGLTISHCADREDTWINEEIFLLFSELHRLGLAHSIEVWVDGELAGGLYGVAIRGVFSGESMFSLVPCASQIALIHLVDRLRNGGFQLLDVQFSTPHLERFGVVQVPHKEYLGLLSAALDADADFMCQPLAESTSSVLQRMSQTSYLG